MTTYSLTDLSTRVLRDLGLLGADESPSAEDLSWASETVQSEVGMLNAMGMPIWNGSELAVPQEYLSTLSRRIGLAIAPSFGLASAAEAQAAMREAERSLTILANPRSGRPISLRTDDATGVSGGAFNFTTGR